MRSLILGEPREPEVRDLGVTGEVCYMPRLLFFCTYSGVVENVCFLGYTTVDLRELF